MKYTDADSLFKGICDEIRAKDGTTALIQHQDIPDRIAAISGSGSGGASFTSPFYTYNGGGLKRLKIEDMVVSDFDVISSIYLPEAFLPGNSAWEIQVKFKLDKNSNKSRNFIIGSTSHPTVLDVLYLAVRDGNTAMGFGIPDGENTYGKNAVSNYDFSINTDYFVKLIYDKSKYAVYISTDGTSFEEIIKINYEKAMKQVGNVMRFGAYGNDNGSVLSGSIDLKETYIKIGNEIWWGKG